MEKNQEQSYNLPLKTIVKTLSHGVESNTTHESSGSIVDIETQRSSILRRGRIPQGAAAAQTIAAVPVNNNNMNKVSKKQMFEQVLSKA